MSEAGSSRPPAVQPMGVQLFEAVRAKASFELPKASADCNDESCTGSRLQFFEAVCAAYFSILMILREHLRKSERILLKSATTNVLDCKFAIKGSA